MVKTLDKIRYEIDESDDEGELFEFYWFAREYPRFYRYHLDHAEFRLKSIHEKYSVIRGEVSKSARVNGHPSLGMSISNPITHQIYWDFEAYLMALSAALDLMARVVGISFVD